MKTNDYVKNYWSAYRELKKAATEKIKDYGKTLEVIEICKQRLMERMGYKNEDEIYEDELDDFKCVNTYSCIVESKHEMLYACTIVMVRYDKKSEKVEAYLESDDGYIAEWYPVDWIGWDEQAVYMTILDFIE